MQLDDYILSIVTPEDPLLTELERATYQRMIQPRMLSGHIQGRLLTLLTEMIRPARVLEIGTFTGYSTLCLAAGLKDGATILTCEPDDELETTIREYFARSAYGERIELFVGSFLDLPQPCEPFDMVFMDGDKREYPAYYRRLMGDDTGLPMVRSGSWIIADNILWYGKAAEEPRDNDRHTLAIREFNRMVADDPRTENAVLPVRDGLNIIRVF